MNLFPEFLFANNWAWQPMMIIQDAFIPRQAKEDRQKVLITQEFNKVRLSPTPALRYI